MTKTARNLNKTAFHLFLVVSILFVLLLTSINVERSFSIKKVLGASTLQNDNNLFWEDLLQKNPGYIPGWIEIGRPDKAKELDPNYF